MSKDSLRLQRLPMKIQADDRPLPRLGLGPDTVSQPPGRHPAQIQAETRGFFVRTAIVAGKALLKDAGQIGEIYTLSELQQMLGAELPT